MPRLPAQGGAAVLLAACVMLFLVEGGRALISITFKPILTEFGATRGAVSGAVLLNMTVFALSLTLMGRAFDRFGARGVLKLSSLLIAAGFLGIARIESLQGFVLWYGLVAAIGFGCASIPLFATLAGKWFDRHRGAAISVVLAAGCLGQSAMILFSSYLVSAYSWRMAFSIAGGLILVINLPLAHWAVRNPPAAAVPGTVSFPGKPGLTNTAALGSAMPVDATLADALGTGSFWLFALAMFICGGGDYLVMTHLVPMITDQGISGQSAGTIMAGYGLANLVGVLVAGRIADRGGNRLPNTATFVIRALAFALLLLAQTHASFMLFTFAFGLTTLVTALTATTLLVTLYGGTHLGLITGAITTIHHIGAGVWAYGAGVAFDTTGNYRLALGAYAIAAVIATGCCLGIREQRHAPRRLRSPC